MNKKELLAALEKAAAGSESALVLRDAYLNDEDAIALAQSPRAAALRLLDLRGNGITDAGAIALAQSPYMKGLQRLDLWRNPITDAGVIALAQSPFLAGLQFLILDHNNLKEEGKTALRLRERFLASTGLDRQQLLSYDPANLFLLARLFLEQGGDDPDLFAALKATPKDSLFWGWLEAQAERVDKGFVSNALAFFPQNATLLKRAQNTPSLPSPSSKETPVMEMRPPPVPSSSFSARFSFDAPFSFDTNGLCLTQQTSSSGIAAWENHDFANRECVLRDVSATLFAIDKDGADCTASLLPFFASDTDFYVQSLRDGVMRFLRPLFHASDDGLSWVHCGKNGDSRIDLRLSHRLIEAANVFVENGGSINLTVSVSGVLRPCDEEDEIVCSKAASLPAIPPTRESWSVDVVHYDTPLSGLGQALNFSTPLLTAPLRVGNSDLCSLCEWGAFSNTATTKIARIGVTFFAKNLSVPYANALLPPELARLLVAFCRIKVWSQGGLVLNVPLSAMSQLFSSSDNTSESFSLFFPLSSPLFFRPGKAIRASLEWDSTLEGSHLVPQGESSLDPRTAFNNATQVLKLLRVLFVGEEIPGEGE